MLCSLAVCQREGAQISSYYVDLCCCPRTDLLLSGSTDGQPKIWDLGKNDRFPILAMQGHSKEVTGVAWSETFDLMATCDDSNWRVWSLPGGHVIRGMDDDARIDHFELPKTAHAEKALSALLLTPASEKNAETPPHSPVKAYGCHGDADENTQPQKRKLAFRSPFKSPANFRSPDAKVNRLGVLNRAENPFYYPTPTWNLPNSVADRAKDRPMKKKGKTAERALRTMDHFAAFRRTPLKDAQSQENGAKKLTVKERERKVEKEPRETKRRSAKTILDFFAKKDV